MQKYYGVVILLNVVGIVAAYKLFGLFIAIGAYAGIYFATRNMTLKKGLPERLSFVVIQLLGVFAVHKFFSGANSHFNDLNGSVCVVFYFHQWKKGRRLACFSD